MALFEFQPILRAVEVLARGSTVGTVTFQGSTREWLAEAGDQACYCPSFGGALAFIAAVVGTDEWVELRHAS